MATCKNTVAVRTSDLRAEDVLTRAAFAAITTRGISERELLVTDEMERLFKLLLQPDKLRPPEPHVIFLEGPPGTGKSTTLYWAYQQCKHMAHCHPVAIPLKAMTTATQCQAN